MRLVRLVRVGASASSNACNSYQIKPITLVHTLSLPLTRDVNETRLWREREREQLNENENETKKNLENETKNHENENENIGIVKFYV